LENAIERALVLAYDSIQPEDLPESVIESGGPGRLCRRFNDSITKQEAPHPQTFQKTNGITRNPPGARPTSNSLHRIIRNLNLKPRLEA